jgi:hypothetical protein
MVSLQLFFLLINLTNNFKKTLQINFFPKKIINNQKNLLFSMIALKHVITMGCFKEVKRITILSVEKRL